MAHRVVRSLRSKRGKDLGEKEAGLERKKGIFHNGWGRQLKHYNTGRVKDDWPDKGKNNRGSSIIFSYDRPWGNPPQELDLVLGVSASQALCMKGQRMGREGKALSTGEYEISVQKMVGVRRI